MSISDYPTKENSHDMKVIQGGEKKVMKKILSVALSTAMAFSMFASVAFGAESTTLTPEQKFDALKAKGIVNGLPDGLAHLEKTLSRAELAKIVAKAMDLKEVTGVYTYKDKGYVAGYWAAPYIEAVTAANIMKGTTVNGKQMFNPTANVTAQELAIVLTRALKLEVPTTGISNTAATWAQGEVQAAINKGLVEANLNWTANATRSQAIVAAYAVDQFVSIPTVASYKVIDANNVEFTLSTGEVVAVKLDKALVANVETPVEFQNKAGQKIATKVTWKVDSATKVQSAAATNLKEVVVTFDGTVDETSATVASNYSISGKTIESATLANDKKSVTLLLSQSSTALVNQKQTSVVVNNVKNSDGSKTLSGTVSFVPSDVAIPTVQEVKALGTKAVKIVFSEPVQQSDVIASNFRIDDKAIAANVQYTYPNTVILTTSLTEGTHTLRVSNVKDYSGLTIVPDSKEFTASVDTTAPTVTSVKSNDLTQVEITFDEPIKSVSGAYANVSSFTTSSRVIKDNKLILNFSSPLNASENNIHLTGVKDYSDNSADLDVKVTPTLDVVRPVVVNTEFEQKGTDYVATLHFSKALNKESAEKASNYVLKDSNGKIPAVAGITVDGNPVRQPVYDAVKRTVTINFGSALKNDNYTLTASGVKDAAYVSNVLLPYTTTLSVAQAQTGVISRAWTETSGATRILYIQFNRTLTTEGQGNAQDATKYFLRDSVSGAKFQAAKSNDDVQLNTANVVRIEVTGNIPTDFSWNNAVVDASYLRDVDGNILGNSAGGYTVSKTVNDANRAISVTGAVYVNSTSKVEINFAGQLNTVVASQFELRDTATGGTYTANGYELSNNNETLTLDFSDRKLPANFSGTIRTVGTGNRDAYGNVVALDPDTTNNNAQHVTVVNKIAPSVTDVKVAAVTAKRHTVTLTFDRNVDFDPAAKNLFSVDLGSQRGTVDSVSRVTANQIQLTVDTTNDVASNDFYSVYFNGTANAGTNGSKVLTSTEEPKTPVETINKQGSF
ncbi:hypothetical protein DCC85_20190 [Paenibacillus sp. CAA11]|uniref:S-layer homology domain-containing protein n=1 Tax=Paenibacillus sp. CAA11 TaxID=1532905 RepID=UPI000D3CBB68|nr:S-layer homology domain-containing protein [Paenibacillus sp. CAA11]AWB46253.1 hypothetical protein DCC85_20190 [Paenibacillus sp. CAA11]